MEEIDYSLVWKEMLDSVVQNVSDAEKIFFSDIKYISATQSSIKVSIGTKFFLNQLVKRYLTKMEDILMDMIGLPVKIDFVIANQKDSNSHQQPKTASPKPHIDGPPVAVKAEPKVKPKHSQLQDFFTFDAYVISTNNNFAANAAIAISKKPGIAYNPFLVYGGAGLGKTHLMQAIGNQVYNSTDLKVIYTTAENFTNEFVSSLSEKKMLNFKNKYRNIDVLLIDDVHFFERTEQVQEELFHTFNALYDAKKQMVFTSDRPLTELKRLSDRLRSRFERGLNVDLSPPNYETRLAILKKKQLLRDNIVIDDEILKLIAKNVSTNVRDLEAAMTKIIAYTELVGSVVTLQKAQELLKDVFAGPKQSNMSIEQIIKVIASEYGLSPADLRGKKRTKMIVLPRQIAMYITQEITEASTTEIGSEFGGRDHSTVIHSCDKIRELIQSDSRLDARIQDLIRTVKEINAKSG